MILRTGLVPALLGLTSAGSLLAGPAVAERAPTAGANGMGDLSFRGTEANTYATNSATSLRRPSTRLTEQRYRAVLEVQAGMPVTEVAHRFGVSRQAVHRWLCWYRDHGLDGLADRSHRPHAHPAQVSAEVEAFICELRRNHPRWGQRRLHYELGRRGCPGPVPSRTTIYRVLVRHGLIDPRSRRRRREDYKRWQRSEPMQLWQMDIVGGVLLADGAEAKVVTGVDDHSRYCVIAAVVARPTGRAVCLALAAALRRYGIPDELLTDIRQTVHRPVRPRR